MALPNWLIPSGVCTFSGNEQQLRAAIGTVDGKLRENGQFTCLLGGGAVSFRFKMKTLFRCAYEKAPGGYAISWQAWPALTAILTFLMLAALSVLGLIWGDLEKSGWLVCLLGLLVFLYVIQRGTCVEQFTEKFGK